MSIIVTDTGFGTDDWTGGFASWDTANDITSLDVPSDADPEELIKRAVALDCVRIDFPSSADGRGFTLAKRLRLAGFKGRLRARGHVLADQYTMARRSGFDEVEIDEDLAARQPEDQWVFRSDWKAHDYRARLRG